MQRRVEAEANTRLDALLPQPQAVRTGLHRGRDGAAVHRCAALLRAAQQHGGFPGDKITMLPGAGALEGAGAADEPWD
jgi:hypothetical protein